ncbi:ATP synthase F1, delta subunit [Syntrophotalea carbinolica DSM 2380]|uniref:ATP synthase subunit delta 1 n=1 Tax=Syntrophotalea carbinolica (strain DSM 2380 / NBRC 103641 / GraBd1) TaxID=338963 RepID=ATPD1_SYNC1|nr:ATP synthase F1 subunit delta [Syntrophotalea carbinolica]Q3A608.1 RecName: Full=ATP synthase subunit delta 1; AltName: Full=ATP synthase F(1) sector subunit delta 1; AltName: Full=F-type ATPase subunit delta 1; Short=F-ATPase subunit delta 1 [Syntrophotalea carbinolica DSM 2380]ABA88199.1 ATP synthase F1, delta subunit [Syntrophotalea carbinolica DSM 2380]
MKSTAISRRYAKALVNLAAPDGQLESTYAQLEQLQQAFACEPRLYKLLASPTLAADKIAGLLEGISNYLQLSTTLRNLLGLLQQRQRLEYFDALVADYRELADVQLGLVRARVCSAAPLDAAVQQAISAQLQKRYGKQAVLELAVEPELLGGVRIEVAGQVLDGTIRSGLRRMAGYLNS